MTSDTEAKPVAVASLIGLNAIEAAIENWWGERCDTFDEDCVCCKAWDAFDMSYNTRTNPSSIRNAALDRALEEIVRYVEMRRKYGFSHLGNSVHSINGGHEDGAEVTFSALEVIADAIGVQS